MSNGTHMTWITENAHRSDDECIRWPFSESDWYHSIWIGGGKWSKAHRMMCLVRHGHPPHRRSVAMHSCNNKWCVNPNHLSWGLPSENRESARKDGLIPTGSSCSRSKITEDDVVNAKKDREGGMTYEQIGKKYGIAKGAIWHAINGSQWKHVK